ncbi:hypothetical protein Tco_0762717 [Tanacetum coccineum]
MRECEVRETDERESERVEEREVREMREEREKEREWWEGSSLKVGIEERKGLREILRGGLVDLRVGPPVGVGGGLESGDGVTLEMVIVGELSCRAKGNLGGNSRGVNGGATLMLLVMEMQAQRCGSVGNVLKGKLPTLITHIPASRLVPVAGKENAAELDVSQSEQCDMIIDNTMVD